MSNRSYAVTYKWGAQRELYNFQFPVGMSNRSYRLMMFLCKNLIQLTFNSPWECRIGLTWFYDGNKKSLVCLFQFPVGMSNRSYRVEVVDLENVPDELSIPRGNVE